MTDLAHKLGIAPGMTLCLLDVEPDVVRVIHACCAPDVTLLDKLPEGERVDIIVVEPDQIDGLVERFEGLAHCIFPNGSIWVVTPKKAAAKKRGTLLTWEAVQAAALQTDLVDNKNAALTDEVYGTRFVIRRDARPRYQAP